MLFIETTDAKIQNGTEKHHKGNHTKAFCEEKAKIKIDID